MYRMPKLDQVACGEHGIECKAVLDPLILQPSHQGQPQVGNHETSDFVHAEKRADGEKRAVLRKQAGRTNR
ncbi:MAG: hypothetical protein CBC48_12360 [bacterium TMED88]|nr:MAG: hypothetical protein CBC48_12360 [bacterium TMED88]